MPFAKSGKTKRVDTHLQWTKSDKFEVGKETEVKLIMMNRDWENISFVGEDFRLNLKAEDDDHFTRLVTDIDSMCLDNKHKVVLRDTSNPDDKEFECEVDFVELPRKMTKQQWERTNKGNTLRLTDK
jgi:hypothetical protein